MATSRQTLLASQHRICVTATFRLPLQSTHRQSQPSFVAAATAKPFASLPVSPETLNRVLLTGNLGADIKKEEVSSVTVGSGSLAVNDGNVVNWYEFHISKDALAKEACEHFKSGSFVTIQGKLAQMQYIDKTQQKRVRIFVEVEQMYTALKDNAENAAAVTQTIAAGQRQLSGPGGSPAPAQNAKPRPTSTSNNPAVQATEEKWAEFFKSPNDYWDNRTKKTNPKAPDFRHKTNKDLALWVDSWSSPDWLQEKLAELDQQRTAR